MKSKGSRRIFSVANVKVRAFDSFLSCMTKFIPSQGFLACIVSQRGGVCTYVIVPPAQSFCSECCVASQNGFRWILDSIMQCAQNPSNFLLILPFHALLTYYWPKECELLRMRRRLVKKPYGIRRQSKQKLIWKKDRSSKVTTSLKTKSNEVSWYVYVYLFIYYLFGCTKARRMRY